MHKDLVELGLVTSFMKTRPVSHAHHGRPCNSCVYWSLKSTFLSSKMPSHCCVPKCTLKGYIGTSREKISFFNFPKSDGLREKWIVAIRRDPGKHFDLKEKTKVCSRHFFPTDVKNSLNGIIKLKNDAVPSIFAWSGSVTRKPPKDRQFTNKDDDCNHVQWRCFFIKWYWVWWLSSLNIPKYLQSH